MTRIEWPYILEVGDSATPPDLLLCRVYSVDECTAARMTAIMNIREIFARNLRKQRQAKGLSQEKLAHLAGIDRTYISSLERCVYAPTIDMVATLAEILEVSPADLLEPDRGNPRSRPKSS